MLTEDIWIIPLPLPSPTRYAGACLGLRRPLLPAARLRRSERHQLPRLPAQPLHQREAAGPGCWGESTRDSRSRNGTEYQQTVAGPGGGAGLPALPEGRLRPGWLPPNWPSRLQLHLPPRLDGGAVRPAGQQRLRWKQVSGVPHLRVQGSFFVFLWFVFNACPPLRCIHGTCLPINSYSYSCRCQPGFSGVLCDEQDQDTANPCSLFRCKHGKCRVSGLGKAYCECFSGYTGEACDRGEKKTPTGDALTT